MVLMEIVIGEHIRGGPMLENTTRRFAGVVSDGYGVWGRADLIPKRLSSWVYYLQTCVLPS